METNRLCVKLVKDAKLPSIEEMTRELECGLEECGAVAAFQGITRNNFNGRKVKTLVYESFETMAVKELKKLGQKAMEDFKLHGISIYHRLGEVVSLETVLSCSR